MGALIHQTKSAPSAALVEPADYGLDAHVGRDYLEDVKAKACSRTRNVLVKNDATVKPSHIEKAFDLYFDNGCDAEPLALMVAPSENKEIMVIEMADSDVSYDTREEWYRRKAREWVLNAKGGGSS